MKRPLEEQYINALEDYLNSNGIYPEDIYAEHLDMEDGLVVRAVLPWAERDVHARYSHLAHEWAERNGFLIVCPDYILGDEVPTTRIFTAKHHLGLRLMKKKK